jgi:hypothetical protein
MAEARREERVPVTLPVTLHEGAGITRDVSPTGIFFETDLDYRAGSSIEFSLELENAGAKMIMKCQAEIVRVEHRDGRVGVAAKIVSSGFFEAQD